MVQAATYDPLLLAEEYGDPYRLHLGERRLMGGVLPEPAMRGDLLLYR